MPQHTPPPKGWADHLSKLPSYLTLDTSLPFPIQGTSSAFLWGAEQAREPVDLFLTHPHPAAESNKAWPEKKKKKKHM